VHTDGLSVVLPLFNGGRYVTDAIFSIINQTELPMNWELIVVDDGSSDDGPARCDVIAQFHPQIRVVRQTHNQGVAAARNFGAKLAKYKYLAFIDQDDIWASNKLSMQFKQLANCPVSSYVLGHQEFFFEPGLDIPKWFKREWGDSPQKGFVLGAMLIRVQEFFNIGLLDETLMLGGDDVDWFARARHKDFFELVLPEVVLKRRVHENNASARTASKHELLYVIRQKLARES
jgi:glycosyltransferase involved in cell wall biosynthesis